MLTQSPTCTRQLAIVLIVLAFSFTLPTLGIAVLRPVHGFEKESDQKWMQYSKCGHSASLQNRVVFLMLFSLTVFWTLSAADSSGIYYALGMLS